MAGPGNALLHGERVFAALAAAGGFAVGRSVSIARGRAVTSSAAAQTLHDAIARVRGELRQLLRALPRAEADLFEPETRILEEVAPRLLARERERQPREDAVVAETSCGCTDLVIDLRVRLLHALEGSAGVDLSAVADAKDASVVVTDMATPTMVASLPRQVVAVVAALDGPAQGRRDVGRTSHAAILARARGVPLVYVTSDVSASAPNGSWVIVDASETDASVCFDPGHASLAAASRRLESSERLRKDAGNEPLDHSGVELRVNVAARQDRGRR